MALAVVVSSLVISSCIQDESASSMPVTTKSDLALEFYETGMLEFDQVKYWQAHHHLELAVKEDPDFFMAWFWLYFTSGKGSKKVAGEALQVESNLNEAEKEIKTAFSYLLDGQEEKVVHHLQMAVDLYPSDPHVHKILYIIQMQYLKDMEGALESINHAIRACPDYAMAYNMLGYAHMDMEEFDRAGKAFDTYIKLAPSIANPYDSKGDYFMKIKEYEKAHESYMRAFEIDPDFQISKKKAEKATCMMEEPSAE